MKKFAKKVITLNSRKIHLLQNEVDEINIYDLYPDFDVDDYPMKNMDLFNELAQFKSHIQNLLIKVLDIKTDNENEYLVNAEWSKNYYNKLDYLTHIINL